mgnify:CR=1 FL=1
MFDLSKAFTQWTFLIFLAFVWGSSFILMKKGLISFSPAQIAALRIFISFLFLLPVMLRNFKKIKAAQWKKIGIAGLLGSGIPAILFPFAQTKISSSLTGMLNSLVPLFAVLIGVLFFKVPFRKLKFIGVFIGLLGAIGLLYASGAVQLDSNNFFYAGLILIATLCYATNVNYIKTALAEVNSIDITSFGFFFIGPPAAIYLFNTDFIDLVMHNKEAQLHLFYIALLAVFGTAVAVILFNMLIKRVSAVFASSVTYIIPVFAIFWGLLDGEKIQILQLFFIGIVLLGVYIVNRDNVLEKKSAIRQRG